MKNSKTILAAMTLSLATPAIISPVQVEAVAPNFKDVPKTHPYYKEIKSMAEAGIIKGSDGKFNPTGNVTRAQAALFMERAMDRYGLRTFTSTNISVVDLSPKMESYDALKTLLNALLIVPNNKKVEPNKPLTRGEMARILEHFFLLTTTTKAPFNDVSGLYEIAVNSLYEAGITTGSNGKFNENQPVSRQHFAVFMARAAEYFNQYPNRDYVTINDTFKDANKVLTYLTKYEPSTLTTGLTKENWDNLDYRNFYAEILPVLFKNSPELRLTGITSGILLSSKNWTKDNTKALFAQVELGIIDNRIDIRFDPYEKNSIEIVKQILFNLLPDLMNKDDIIQMIEVKYQNILASGIKEKDLESTSINDKGFISHGLYHMEAKIPSHFYTISIHY